MGYESLKGVVDRLKWASWDRGLTADNRGPPEIFSVNQQFQSAFAQLCELPYYTAVAWAGMVNTLAQ